MILTDMLHLLIEHFIRSLSIVISWLTLDNGQYIKMY